MGPNSSCLCADPMAEAESINASHKALRPRDWRGWDDIGMIMLKKSSERFGRAVPHRAPECDASCTRFAEDELENGSGG